LRIPIVALAALFLVPSVQGQHQPRQRRTNPPAPCGDESRAIPDFYYQAVVDRFKPPGYEKALIKIAVGSAIKIFLLTDEEKFELWTETPVTPQKNVHDFLLDLDQSCRLPPDPADAAALVKVTWESRELSAAQFAQLHRDFMSALSQYVSKIQERYGSREMVEYLDAIRFPIVYENEYEHIEVDVWNDPRQYKPMLDWIHELQKLAEDSFHHPIWRE
jgi:hypothetical protein